MESTPLGKRVLELRKRNGFSQEQLAEYSGLNLRTIQRIEKGESTPRGDSLIRLSRALNVSHEELMESQPNEDSAILKALALSQLFFIVFPILGLIVPSAIWINQKNKIKGVNQLGKAIINFQVSWFITTFFLLALFSYLKVSHTISFDLWAFFWLIGLCYLVNIIFVTLSFLGIREDKIYLYMPFIKVI